jgi:hypothetical protein
MRTRGKTAFARFNRPGSLRGRQSIQNKSHLCERPRLNEPFSKKHSRFQSVHGESY